MEALKKLVTDELARRREVVAEAELREINAAKTLDEAKANAKREREDYEQMKAWLEAQP